MKNSSVIIRKMQQGEAAAVSGLVSQVFNLAASDGRQEIAVSRDAMVLVAVHAGKIIGSVSCLRVRQYFGDFLSIYALAVAPEERGNGIGRSLMERLEDDIKKEWLHPGEEILVGLTDAIREARPESRFYERLGYQVDEENSRATSRIVATKYLQR